MSEENEKFVIESEKVEVKFFRCTKCNQKAIGIPIDYKDGIITNIILICKNCLIVKTIEPSIYSKLLSV